MLGQRQRSTLKHKDAVDLGLIIRKQFLGQGGAETAATNDDQVKRTASPCDTCDRLVESVAGVSANNIDRKVSGSCLWTGWHGWPPLGHWSNSDTVETYLRCFSG